MKIKSIFHISVFFTAVMVFSMPFVTVAQQQSVQAEAVADAERAAAADVNTTLWFLGGCVGGVIVLIIANVHKPFPPAASLLGKSPEYVAFYTDAYRAKASTIQTSQAVKGCIANAVVGGACYGCLVMGSIAARD